MSRRVRIPRKLKINVLVVIICPFYLNIFISSSLFNSFI